MSDPSAADIIAGARMQVYLKHPYLSPALFALRLCPVPGLGTLAVDEGWRLYYDPDTVIRWHREEVEGMLAAVAGTGDGHDGVAGVVFHEVGHVLRQHFGRRGDRDPFSWNMATDREINDDVIEAGWKLPGVPLLPRDVGMSNGLTAEEYYVEHPRRREGGASGNPFDLLAPGCGGACGGASGNPTAWEESQPGGTLRTGVSDPKGSCSPPPGGEGDLLFPSPCDPLEQEIVLRQTARDVQEHIKQHGQGSVPAGLQAWADAKLEPPRIDWRRHLAGLVRRALAATAGASDWTWRRPGRRALHSAGRPGWPLAPAYHQPTPTVGVVLDTSGSMGCERDGRTYEDEALSEVLGIARAAGADVWAVACDADAYDPVRVRDVRDLAKLNRGGGGTDMRPGYEAVVRARGPDVVIIVTDGLVGGGWPDRLACRGRRVIGCVVGGTGQKAPEWIETVEVN